MPKFIHTALLIVAATAALAQDRTTIGDHPSIKVNQTDAYCGASASEACERALVEHGLAVPHPYTLIARHPKPGCANTAECGEIFYEYHGINLRTSAGTTWQSQIMGDTSTPSVNAQCNYMALTNTAVTPAEADTSLSGEIAINGLSRAQGTYTDASTTLSVPSTPTVSPQGTTGSTTYYYWVAATNQSIPTTLSTSGTTATSNATLSASNYNQVSWSVIAGASSYAVYRTTSSSAPTSGSGSVQVNGYPSCSSTTCTMNDISNTLVAQSPVIAASNLTNFGKFTLIHTWTATATQQAQAFGILTASSGGTMCFEGTFTQVSLNNADTFQFTEVVYF